MALTYRVEIKNLAELQTRFKQAPDLTAKHLIVAGNKSLVSLQGSAKQLAPIDQGPLRAGIQVTPMRRTGSVIAGSVNATRAYSIFQEAGTGIYGPRKAPIRPKNGKFLVFKGRDGKTIFARQVKGSRPRWFMKGSVEQNQSKIDRYFEQAADNITKDLAT